ncbi:MAG: hypothetical protein WD232_09995 [Acidimicrobiales bacterium]
MSALNDPASGLLNAAYFEAAVPERVELARRTLRPLSIILIRSSSPDVTASERATVVRGCIRRADTVCQLDDEVVGLILEDTPEDGAICVGERLRSALGDAMDATPTWGSVATYPAHALDADGLLGAARHALEAAAAWPESSIVVARQH